MMSSLLTACDQLGPAAPGRISAAVLAEVAPDFASRFPEAAALATYQFGAVEAGEAFAGAVALVLDGIERRLLRPARRHG